RCSAGSTCSTPAKSRDAADECERRGQSMMISAPEVVGMVLAEAARLSGADETIVLVTDRSTAALRWAGNSMTTNGESVSRDTTVISIVRKGDTAHVGSVRSSDVDPALIAASVAASQRAAAAAPEA